MRRTIAMVLEYEGLAYAGSQRQTNAPSVQAVVEAAVESLTGLPTRLRLAGRTDAGVHATGQVAAFESGSALSADRFRQGLNHFLPDDVVVTAAYDVPPGFDPRRRATSRVYRYTLLCGESRPALRRRTAYYVGRPLDLAAMQQALAYLEGRRDFAPFSSAVEPGKSTVRLLTRTAVWREANEAYLELEGNAFLPQQVRRIAGTVLQVGLGKRTIEAFQALADSGVRGAADWVLPAHGLCLRRVNYPDFPPGEYAGRSHDHSYISGPAEPSLARR